MVRFQKNPKKIRTAAPEGCAGWPRARLQAQPRGPSIPNDLGRGSGFTWFGSGSGYRIKIPGGDPDSVSR